MKKKTAIALTLTLIVAVVLATRRGAAVSHVAPAIQQQERQPTKGQQLVENLRRAASEKAKGSSSAEQELQVDTDDILLALSRAVKRGRAQRIESLVAELNTAGIHIQFTPSGGFSVRFPKGAWLAPPKRAKEGINQEDFCYTGWTAIDETWVVDGASSCTYHLITYSCYESQSIMNCMSIRCGGPLNDWFQSCSEEIPLVR